MDCIVFSDTTERVSLQTWCHVQTEASRVFCDSVKMLSPNPIFRDPPQGTSHDWGAVMPGGSWALTGSPEGSILKHLFFPVFETPSPLVLQSLCFPGSGLWLRSPGTLRAFKSRPGLKESLLWRSLCSVETLERLEPELRAVSMLMSSAFSRDLFLKESLLREDGWHRNSESASTPWKEG